MLRNLGINPDKLANECRDYQKPVLPLETQRLNIWTFYNFPGGSGGIADTKTGETIEELKSPGALHLSTYRANFESACKNRDLAVENSSLQSFKMAIIEGFASLESFLSEEAEKWNQRNPDDKLIDSKEEKVSVNRKLDSWIPKMTNGVSLEKGGEWWGRFIKLQKVRDDFVHPKRPCESITLKDLASLINAFRFGVAAILGQLHINLGKAVPSIIINAFYMSDVVVKEEDQ